MKELLKTAGELLRGAGTFLENVRDYPYREAARTLWNYPYRKKAVQQIRDTRREIGVIALLGTLAWTGYIYRDRAARAGEIPLAFGEVGRITKQLAREGKKLGPINKFYLWVSEVNMKYFESSNIALSIGNRDEIFAHELETRVDPSMKVWAQLPEYTNDFHNVAQEALHAMDKYVQAANRLPAANDNLSNTWSYTYNDDTHTVHHYSQVCDDKGKNCTTVDDPEEVCDRRHHKYTFNATAGRAAGQQLDSFVAAYPDLVVAEEFALATATGADNEYAIEKSRQRELKYRRLTQKELLGYTNTYATGSNYMVYRREIEGNYNQLASASVAWHNALKTAKTTRYTTACWSTPTPMEYDVAELAEKHGEATVESVHKIIDGIMLADKKVPHMLELTKKFIPAAFDPRQGNSRAMRNELMDTSREVYETNIGNGFDIWPFKWGEVALHGLGALLFFTALGVGVDRTITKFQLLGRRAPGEKDIPWPDLPDEPHHRA